MKAFASDFDNTLRFRNEETAFYKDEDLKAIQEFQKNGNVFGLCTGRPLYGLREDLQDGPELDFIIGSTGGQLVRIEDTNMEKVQEACISASDAQEVLHATERAKSFFVHSNGQYEQVSLENGMIAYNDITGISIYVGNEEDAAWLRQHLIETCSNVEVYQNRDWLDVVASGVSKGSGVLQMKDYYKADIVAGIGDSYNDITMLQKADVSFTFHSSPENVKKEADYIVDSVAEAIAIFEKL